MFNVGGGEVLVILLVALLVLGPDKLPEAARNAGKMVRQIRQLSSGFQQEIRDALDDTPSSRPPSGVPGTSSGPALPPLGESSDLSAAAVEAAVAGEVVLSPEDGAGVPGASEAGSGHRPTTPDEMTDRPTQEQGDLPRTDISFDGPATSFG